MLQVGRITGWEVALAIGARTYKKQEITAADIIEPTGRCWFIFEDWDFLVEGLLLRFALIVNCLRWVFLWFKKFDI